MADLSGIELAVLIRAIHYRYKESPSSFIKDMTLFLSEMKFSTNLVVLVLVKAVSLACVETEAWDEVEAVF